MCYDRVERRELFFIENLEVPLGTVSDINVYGFPAPTVQFVELTDGVVTKEYRASHWLYTECQAKRGTVGQRAPTPSPSELPLTSVLRKDSSKASQSITKSTPSQSVPPPSSTPVAKTSAPPPQKPIPTEPRAHRQRNIQSAKGLEEQKGESSLGRRPRTLTLEGGESTSERGKVLSKRLRSMEPSTERNNESLTIASALLTPLIPPLPE